MSIVSSTILRKKYHTFTIYIIYHHFYSQEPVKLVGGGKFNLNSVREIKVTESYLGLDQSVKACKDEEEPKHDCITTLYIDTSLNNCGCLPLSIRNDEKVCMFKIVILHNS